MNTEKTAICAILRNEHSYLKEWIDYHLSIGIDYIYLYEDVGDTHEEICKEYDNVFLTPIKDFVTYEHSFAKQACVYDKFIEQHKDKITYAFFIDLDEFVMFEDGYDLKSLIDICNDMGGGVLLPWKMYGAEGLVKKPNTNVLDTYKTPSSCIFTQEEMTDKTVYKTFCRTDRGPMEGFHAHPVAKTLVPWGAKNIYSVCWINHYITKSWEEWCEKLFVRKQNIPVRILNDFFRYNPDMLDIKDELREFAKNYSNNIDFNFYIALNEIAEKNKERIHQEVMEVLNRDYDNW